MRSTLGNAALVLIYLASGAASPTGAVGNVSGPPVARDLNQDEFGRDRLEGAALTLVQGSTSARGSRSSVNSPCPASIGPRHGDELTGSERPRNGKGLPDHELSIDNGTRTPAIVKIDEHGGGTAQRYFIGTGQQLHITLGDGTYEIQYVMNPRLAVDCKTVLRADQIMEFPELHELRIEDNGDSWGYHRLSFTLYAVRNGNVRPGSISLDEFNRD